MPGTMIEFQISDRATTPPGGWHYVQPQSGRVFNNYSREAFFREIMDHRLANGYELTPTWQEEIEDQICRAHPEWGREICRRTEPLGLRKPISFAAMQSFLNVMGAWVLDVVRGGNVYVDPEEATRRAVICAGCEFNVPMGFSCGGCADRILRGLTRVIASRETPYDDKLGSCAICSCALRAAVWLPLEAQQAGIGEELRAEFRKVNYCWKNQGL